MATKPRPAKDVKVGSTRAEFLEKAKGRKPRAAKDVKPGSLREKSLKSPAKKGVPGTSTESRRISDVKKSRGPFGQLVPRKENVPAKAEEPKRGVVKYEEPKRGVVKYEGPKRGVATRPGAAGIAGRGLSTVVGRTIGGPVGALVGMTTPAGEGSDKPSGPLMKGGKLPGYTYLPDKKEDRRPRKMISAGGGPEKRQGSSAPSMARPAAPKKAAPKPEVKKAAPKVAEKKTFAKKAEAPAKPTFRGNWVGAAPTAMQARLGQRIKGRRTFGRDR